MTSASWPSQKLRNLERTGALKHEGSSAAEIRRLLELARGNLTSAALKNNPLEVRYQVAYAAAHYFALAALRANDFRTAGREGHRQLLFQALPHSAGIDSSIALALDRAHRKRNELGTPRRYPYLPFLQLRAEAYNSDFALGISVLHDNCSESNHYGQIQRSSQTAL